MERSVRIKQQTFYTLAWLQLQEDAVKHQNYYADIVIFAPPPLASQLYIVLLVLLSPQPLAMHLPQMLMHNLHLVSTSTFQASFHLVWQQ